MITPVLFSLRAWSRGLLLVLVFLLPASGCANPPVHVAPYTAGDPPYLEREEVQRFISEMVEEGFSRAELIELFRSAKPQQRVIDLMTRPAEARPWYSYRPIFVNARRIEEGERFWQENESLLLRAQETFRVNAEVIVAIIGVETNYGRNQGSFPVFDTLVTLGFDYPPRQTFFRSELGHFLRLVREEPHLDLREVKGSYAGAMGRGQFISSSYRAYAVDFSGDGQRDLIGSWPDAIGSVANYFKQHGWVMGDAVVVPARVEGEAYKALLGGGFLPRHSLEDLARHGVRPAANVAPDQLFSLIELQTEDGVEVWLGLNNFYVITRYNRSPLYAMAVHQLSQGLIQARHSSIAR